MKDTPNKLNRYRVVFPFTCRFTIPSDDHNTTVTVTTKSACLMHGTSENDVQTHLDTEHEIDGPLHSKRILKFVREEMWQIDPREVEVSYDQPPTIELASHQTVEKIVQAAIEED